MPFITHYGEPLIARNDKGEVVRIIPQYAYWGYDPVKGKEQVLECSDDLQYLKEKYNITNDMVIDISYLRKEKENEND